MSKGHSRAKKPVTRAQAVADFERKKVRQRRRHAKRQVLMMLAAGGGAYMVVAVAFMGASGKLQQMVTRTEARFWQSTAQLGFRVDQITLEGRKHADMKEVKAALGLVQGAPILTASLTEMKERLELIPEVQKVQISRILPNELAITLTERVPVAWWQKNGALQLIDAEGVVLSSQRYREKVTLPVVVGEDAPKHVSELIALLAIAPSLKPDVVAAVRVGERRWNVELAREVVVMLPENNPDKAWKRFATLVEKEALLSKAIRSVDMRMEDRVFIMPAEQRQNPIMLTTARET